MSKPSKTSIILLIAVLLINPSEECKCPEHLKGTICGGVLRNLARDNAECKFKTVYSCSGEAATEVKSCGNWPCISRQDLQTAEVIGQCFPKYQYLFDYEGRKIKMAEIEYGR